MSDDYIVVYRRPDDGRSKTKIPLPMERKRGRPPHGAINCDRCHWQIPSDPIFCLACGKRLKDKKTVRAGGTINE